jgi:hypothetical protein
LFRVANNPFGIKYCHFGRGDQVPLRSAEQVSTDRPTTGSSDLPIAKCQLEANLQVAGSADQQFTASSGQPITPPPANPLPDPYGAFDALTWEIENGQKKSVIAQFQCFPNLDEAFTAHALLLRGLRYRPAFAVRGDWKQFAERLGPKTSPLDMEHCGYSTNPSYSAELIKIVSLYRLDDPRALQWFATGQDPGYRTIEASDQRVSGKESDRSTDESLKSSAAG